ncbi:MAG: alpha/beta hydrolase [Gammaproteobacteria bacterium]
MPYKPVKAPLRKTVSIRHLDYCLNCWGNESTPPVFLLHGWADNGMTFQFLADCMSDDWFLIAPDWRGFGGSERARDGYWFPDYLADLDALLELLSPDRPARLIGHSMGGNVAWMYAGIRPERVSHVVSLDVFGLPDSSPEQAPDRYRQWLQQCREGTRFSDYPDRETVIDKLIQLAPRLSRDKAAFLAEYWCTTTAQGGLTLKADPAHRRVNPVLYRREEARSCWRNITARTMLVMGTESRLYRQYRDDGYREDVHACIPGLFEEIIPDCGHMLHQERPRELARLLESFLS